MWPDLSLSMPTNRDFTCFSSTSGEVLRNASISSANVIVPEPFVSASKKISLSFPTSERSRVCAMVIKIVFFIIPKLAYLFTSSNFHFASSSVSIGPSAFFNLTVFRTCCFMFFALVCLSTSGGGGSLSSSSSSSELPLMLLPRLLLSSISESSFRSSTSSGRTNSGFVFFLTSACQSSQILSTTGAQFSCKLANASLAVQRFAGSCWRQPVTKFLA
mmetsp:Transcript_17891/g.29356  ORF Transcript_17891/g.29356 Transcript_17891/m.29356 type:complete len:217 (+) Transcript_17891:371-1021(+)